MAELEIVHKLNEILGEIPCISSEKEVVYFMVQMRKILDHKSDHWKTGSHTLLRFYCDWTVHTEKDRVTENMRQMMSEIYLDAKKQIENPAAVSTESPSMDFAYMKKLRVEILEATGNNGISAEHFKNDESWLSFVSTLIRILENQPINNPTEDIASFTFYPAVTGCVHGVVVFNKEILGYGYYEFRNVY